MNWVFNNFETIGDSTVAHLVVAIPTILLSFIISIPIGWAANRFHWSRGAILAVCALLYAIPSLPLLIVLPIVIGTGYQNPINVIIALTVYGIALMARSTADGLTSVDADVRQSADAMGYAGWSRFWRVEFPLAGPVLLAGLRVVSVSTISLTTVGAVLGINSLGALFTDGFQRNIPAEIITGIVITLALALIVDALLVLLGRVLMPWTRAGKVSRRNRRSTETNTVAIA